MVVSVSEIAQQDSLSRTIETARNYLLSRQRDDGSWWGVLLSNVCMEAEYVMLLHILERRWPEREEAVKRYILSTQQSDGSWSIYHGAPGDLNATIEAYQALKILHVSPDNEALVRARQFIAEHGGIQKSRVFTRLWLAMMGQYDWDALPILPPEVMWLPAWFSKSIWDFSSWARPTVVALSILMAKRPVFPVTSGEGIEELEMGVPETPARHQDNAAFFYRMDAFLHRYHRWGFHPGRQSAIEKAFKWLVDRQEPDGSWGGIQPPWFYALIAFKVLNRTEHPAFKKGWEGLEGFGVQERDGRWWFQACISPTWDTALALLALKATGMSSTDPALVRAGQWLVAQQVLDVRGDWAVRRPKLKPGGWPFEFVNDHYPDVDDTALVLMALNQLQLPDEGRRKRAMTKGFRWMVGMQSQNGGWGAFDADNIKDWVSQIPFSDFGWVNDPPTEDVTGHVLEALGQFGYDDAWPVIAKAVAFLQKMQQADGSFFGRWGVNYLYGVGAVLPGLKAIHYDLRQPWVQRALDWVESVQLSDGGWGESCDTYRDPSLKGQGPSTPSQTAWALLALIAGDRVDSLATQRGIEYLVRHQNSDGGWDEDDYTGTGFPGDFYINYTLYRHVFPILALGRYAKALA